jgi:predicted nucleic acid-binding Zn ribbon protein
MDTETNTIRVCLWCGKTLKMGKRKKSYCGSSCRVYFSKAKKQRKEFAKVFDRIEEELHQLRERVLGSMHGEQL